MNESFETVLTILSLCLYTCKMWVVMTALPFKMLKYLLRTSPKKPCLPKDLWIISDLRS